MPNLFDVDVDSGGRLKFTTTDALGNTVRISQKDTVKTLNGSGWLGTENVEGSYQLIDYHFANDYEVSTTNGSIRISGNLIYYTPALIGQGGFTVNGIFYPVTVSTNRPNKPTITSPTAGSTTPTADATITTSAFSDGNVAVTHAQTRWQIAIDPDFRYLVVDTTSASALTSLTQTLSYGQTYYARAQHIGNLP